MPSTRWAGVDADGLTFDQWVLFLATTFRARYLGIVRARYAELEPRLPLARGGKLTVVQVNSGEAVHFIYTAAEGPQAAEAKHLSLTPPDGLALRDWAMLHEQGYKRFVERAVAGSPLAHFVVFPRDDDGHDAASLAGEASARAHAAELRGSHA